MAPLPMKLFYPFIKSSILPNYLLVLIITTILFCVKGKRENIIENLYKKRFPNEFINVNAHFCLPSNIFVFFWGFKFLSIINLLLFLFFPHLQTGRLSKMSSFSDSATHSLLFENSPLDFLIPSEYPIFNTSTFQHQIADHSVNHSYYACPSAGPNNLGRYISMILFTVVCIIGLFGNSLVIYVVLRYN